MNLQILENAELCAQIAPEIGGRVVSLVYRATGRELLWRNPKLELRRCAPGDEYDPNFYGGMDELLPNDIPETIDGVACPDHGELWTLPLTATWQGVELALTGHLPRCGLSYQRRMRLDGNRMYCDYQITNPTRHMRHFLWKLHAALRIHPGDRIECPARMARPVDAAWTRQRSMTPFAWPHGGSPDPSLVPAADGSAEFLFLYDLTAGRMGIKTVDGFNLQVEFDRRVFPCCWYFASYGAMDGAYTAVLEPCTNMPVSVNDAATEGCCAVLRPGEILSAQVIWTVTGPAT